MIVEVTIRSCGYTIHQGHPCFDVLVNDVCRGRCISEPADVEWLRGQPDFPEAACDELNSLLWGGDFLCLPEEE
ncbi:MAG: hypothetical protein COU10_02900 [Candidatus Harrisonbacteria bacterium CG10_big_fil_rev_8_21_14_0_10_45_28]|uniref:Uncharacterized protein n=1 Tax=Candidatus Harrisonbacteria bacterium CG10_big_fil_rev_8_21_14_0_10_45_28 TaxID=1974586 RepID=A0A2H0UMZ7_9BACT|nr:MAG: hypothetical protein COU10_02900 [Candidatus Harrisonbacteria bacterium CG10_big_fil_rev_8_21_14_0_10_45_28]